MTQTTNPKYLPLLQPLAFANGITLRNRVAVAPMSHYSSFEDGSMNPQEVAYIQRRSQGPGLVMTACYFITPNGKGFVGQPGIYDDRFITDLKKIASAIKSEGAVAVLQLHHGGIVCRPELIPNGDVVGPSNVRLPKRGHVDARELSTAEVEELVIAFGQGAYRAIEAGFDGIELHGAFGYLLQQFLSPYTNRRSDKWGDRFAFPLAVISEVQRIVALHAKGPFLVGYRLTPEEDLDPGLTMAHALAFTEALVQSRVDFIDILVNDYRSNARAGVEDLSQKRLTLLSQQIAGRIPLFGGGSIYTAEDGLAAYNLGLDGITLAREMIMDPEWVKKITEGNEDQIITKLQQGEQAQLQITDQLWKVIWETPGWFPGTLK